MESLYFKFTFNIVMHLKRLIHVKKLLTIFVCLHFFAATMFSGIQTGTTVISKGQAIRIAQSYLQIQNLKEYKIKVESELITSDSYNTYKKLGNRIRKIAWVVTFIMPEGIGASRTVYVDKKKGEILGGYSSK